VKGFGEFAYFSGEYVNLHGKQWFLILWQILCSQIVGASSKLARVGIMAPIRPLTEIGLVKTLHLSHWSVKVHTSFTKTVLIFFTGIVVW
jgi:hypothetical protein